MSKYIKSDISVNVLGETCPIPLVEMRKAVMKAKKGQIIEIMGTHAPSKKEIPMAVQSLGLKIIQMQDDADGVWHFFIRK